MGGPLLNMDSPSPNSDLGLRLGLGILAQACQYFIAFPFHEDKVKVTRPVQNMSSFV